MVQQLKSSARKISHRWFNQFHRPAVSSPAWPLNSDHLSRATVYWPTEYQWTASSVFLEPIRLGMGHWAKLERRSIPQPYQGIGVFELEFDGHLHRVAIDYSDYVDSINYDCLATVSLYFKMQHQPDGYGLEERQRGKILPGGYVMADHRLTPHLHRLRERARKAPPQFNIYGRFGLEFASGIRTQVVDLLRSEPGLGYEGGTKKVPYRQSLIEASRSRICIDLPGNGDFCFRLLDYLAVGAFVIAYPHRTVFPLPLIDRYHVVYMKPDLSDLVELCRYYLDHPAERNEIQTSAAEFFDNQLNYVQLGSWYLQQCLYMASGVPEPSSADPLAERQYRQSAA